MFGQSSKSVPRSVFPSWSVGGGECPGELGPNFSIRLSFNSRSGRGYVAYLFAAVTKQYNLITVNGW